MHDLTTGADDKLLAPIGQVLGTTLSRIDGLRPEQVMIVGAWCRDIWHHVLGHRFRTVLTQDLDLAIAVSSWRSFTAIAEAFPRDGDSGVRFRIAGMKVDVLPFGEIEDPTGTTRPPTRDETMSVWAFGEIFERSLPLELSGVGTVRIPSIPGFTAAKLAAWLDRSEWNETKDATDIGLVLYWYAESAKVQSFLYATPAGEQILVDEDVDLPLSAARLLGVQVIDEIGPDRAGELLQRWPGNAEPLARALVVRDRPNGPLDLERRVELVEALARGLRTAHS